MGSNITMTCCSSEEIIPAEDKPELPTAYTYPEYSEHYNFPRSDSQITKIALEDYKKP